MFQIKILQMTFCGHQASESTLNFDALHTCSNFLIIQNGQLRNRDQPIGQVLFKKFEPGTKSQNQDKRK